MKEDKNMQAEPSSADEVFSVQNDDAQAVSDTDADAVTEENPSAEPQAADVSEELQAESLQTEAIADAEVSDVPQPTVRKGILIPKPVMLAGAVIATLCLAGAIVFGMWISGSFFDPWKIESGLIDYGGLSSDAATSDQIVVPGYGEILLEADTRKVMLTLPNYAGNPCYFRFSIVLKDSGEAIYTSGLVPPGKAIEKLTLKRALPSGNYPAIIQIETFSLDASYTPMNGANVETVLNLR